MKYLRVWRAFTIIGLLGMVLLVVVWNGWLSPVQNIPRSIEILILLSPLLFFVRGVLYGRYSTHVKVTFPAILYFILGVWYALTPQEEIYGYLMLLFSLMLYFGGFLYARAIMIEDKKSKEAANSA